jgi:putative transcriptional regulator
MKNRVRDERAKREWSQAELAERLSVSRQTVNAIETGKYDPSLPLAFKLAEIFGAKIEELFEPDGIQCAKNNPTFALKRNVGHTFLIELKVTARRSARH